MTILTRKGLLLLVAVAAVAAGAALALVQKKQPSVVTVATVYDTPRALPPFALINSDEQPRSVADLRGQWSWLFFGFTSCPDVCPATLSILANAVTGLAPDEKPQIYLITVDPQRDTTARLARYVEHFDPSFDALTGSLTQIEQLAAGLFAAFAKVPLDDGDYTMDHFAGIYFVNPDAQVVAVSTTPHTATQLAADYRHLRRQRR